MIDSNGRIFGKLNILDLIVLLLIIGLVFVFINQYTGKNTGMILSSNQKFYVTFVVEKVRDFTVEAAEQSDLFYEQHGQIIGKKVQVTTENAKDILKKDDGTALFADIEGKKNLYITMECSGNINDTGYFVNGNKQLSVGSDIVLKSNVLLTTGRVFKITKTLDEIS